MANLLATKYVVPMANTAPVIIPIINSFLSNIWCKLLLIVKTGGALNRALLDRWLWETRGSPMAIKGIIIPGQIGRLGQGGHGCNGCICPIYRVLNPYLLPTPQRGWLKPTGLSTNKKFTINAAIQALLISSLVIILKGGLKYQP